MSGSPTDPLRIDTNVVSAANNGGKTSSGSTMWNDDGLPALSHDNGNATGDERIHTAPPDCHTHELSHSADNTVRTPPGPCRRHIVRISSSQYHPARSSSNLQQYCPNNNGHKSYPNKQEDISNPPPTASQEDNTIVVKPGVQITSQCQHLFPDYEHKKIWHLSKRSSAYQLCEVQWTNAVAAAAAAAAATDDPEDSKDDKDDDDDDDDDDGDDKYNDTAASTPIVRNLSGTGVVSIAFEDDGNDGSHPRSQHNSSAARYHQRKSSTNSYISTMSSRTLTSYSSVGGSNITTPTTTTTISGDSFILSPGPLKRRFTDKWRKIRRKMSLNK